MFIDWIQTTKWAQDKRLWLEQSTEYASTQEPNNFPEISMLRSTRSLPIFMAIVIELYLQLEEIIEIW